LVELYLHSPSMPSWCGAQLGGAQGQLYLYQSLHILLWSIWQYLKLWLITWLNKNNKLSK
jgi:hypothetical protein